MGIRDEFDYSTNLQASKLDLFRLPIRVLTTLKTNSRWAVHAGYIESFRNSPCFIGSSFVE